VALGWGCVWGSFLGESICVHEGYVWTVVSDGKYACLCAVLWVCCAGCGRWVGGEAVDEGEEVEEGEGEEGKGGGWGVCYAGCEGEVVGV